MKSALTICAVAVALALCGLLPDPYRTPALFAVLAVVAIVVTVAQAREDQRRVEAEDAARAAKRERADLLRQRTVARLDAIRASQGEPRSGGLREVRPR